MSFMGQIPGLSRKERSRFDEALAYFQAKTPPGLVLRFRGVPVDKMVWTERDKIRVVLEYDKERQGFVMRNGCATVFAPPMTIKTPEIILTDE